VRDQVGSGKDGRKPLSRALRRLGNGRKGRKPDLGVVEAGCLELCPKRRVVVIDAAVPGTWLLAEAGTSIEDVAERLRL